MQTGNKQVFKWSQRQNWKSVLRRLLADKINEAVIAEIRANPRHFADNGLRWLRSEDIPAILAERLSHHYGFIIGFHGTRSDSPADFLDHGIRLSDIKARNQSAVEHFGDSDAIQKAIIECHRCSQRDHGKIYVALTKDVFLKIHPHYLYYGSENIYKIAQCLGRTAELAAKGKPFIVECLIPTNFLESELSFWRGRSYEMLEDYFKKVFRPSETWPVNPSNTKITQPIPAENILSVHEFSEFHSSDAPEKSILLRFKKRWPGKAKLPLPSIPKFIEKVIASCC